MRVLCRLPEPVLASTLLAAARAHTVCVSLCVMLAFESPWSVFSELLKCSLDYLRCTRRDS